MKKLFYDIACKYELSSKKEFVTTVSGLSGSRVLSENDE